MKHYILDNGEINTVLVAGDLLPDGPEHVVLVGLTGEPIMRLPKAWIRESSEAETVARLQGARPSPLARN